MEMDMADSDNSGEGSPLNVVRGENEENEENGSSAHTSSDISEKPNVIYRGKVRDKENVIIKDDDVSDDSDDDDDGFVENTETEQTACPHSSSAPVPLPHLFPLGEIPQRITPDMLLAALREEEPGVPNPDTIHRDCYDAMNVLKKEGILNKYVLSEDDAAVLCAIPMLAQLKSGSFSMKKMVESCIDGTPSKLFVIMLTALRKLPRFKDTMYIESEIHSEEGFEAKKRRKHEVIQYPIYVATKGMSSTSGTTDTVSPREVFRVEEGWGYDISDFAPERDEGGRYAISYGGDIVIIEPWQKFKVVNSGIYRPQERISIVPVKKVDSELVYCTEIVPNVSSHAVRIMKEGMDDVNVVRNMLKILTTHPFDTPYDNRTTIRKDGGIECLIDCYNKHNALAKEVIACLRNVIGEAGICFGNAIGEESSARILFDEGFIKTIADLTFENIGDPVFCQSSSAIIKATCSSFTYIYNLVKLFQDIRGFELILELLLNHKTNDAICSNTLDVLRIILLLSNNMRISEDTFKSLFDSGLIEIVDSIWEDTREETLIKMCGSVLSAIHTKKLGMFIDFNIDEHVDSLCRRNKIIHSIFNQFEINEERLIELSKKLSINNEIITEDDIKAALQGIGISDPEKILRESKEVYATNKNVLNKSYILSEEEAIVIESYIYEDEENKNMSPYRIINKKLRDENNAQDQMDDEKSYLRLLLKALRKLPREKPQTLYRGICDDEREYVKGGEIKWGGFSSTTKSIKKAHEFVKSEETNEFSGTLFEVRNVWGYNIKDLSHFDEGEVLLEPMMKFVVKDVKKEGSLTRVVLEPKEDQSFLFIDSIPPSCTQYIISNLKSSTDPKEICRMCDILRKVPMDDDASPDSRRMFREYGGAILLCDLFKEHRNPSITKALVHVMDPRDEMTNEIYVGYISEAIYACSTEETIDEETNLLFLDFLDSLNAKNIKIALTKEITKGFSILVNRFIDNKLLCLEMLKIFRSNYFDAKEIDQIVEDMLSMVKRIIKTHLSDPEICKLGCLIITKGFFLLKNSDGHLEQVGEEDRIKVLVEAMKMHIDDADICILGCSALGNMVRSNVNNQNMAREAGCIAFVLDMISKRIDNVDACRSGCGALLDLVEYNGASQKEAKRLNGIEIVLDAINKHSYDEIICICGCGALSEMIDDGDIGDSSTKVKAINIMLDVMSRYIRVGETCYHGYKTFGTLLFKKDDVRDSSLKVSVIRVILNSINIHGNNIELCYYGCKALGIILQNNNDIRDNITKVAVVETILNVINTYVGVEEICGNGCYILDKMVDNCGIQDNQIRIDVIKTVLKVMNTHINEEICRFGCCILYGVSVTHVIQDNPIIIDVIKTVLNVINTHINNGEICGYGCYILWNNSEANSVIQKIAYENGCVDILLKVLEAHADNESICGSCCGALGVILSSQDPYSRYCTDDVLSIIGGCHANHKDSTRILQFLMGLMRKEDSKVHEAIERGACTKEDFPKCSDDCKSDENTYCPKCCIQQKAFRCRTCDKDKILLYCETCWRRDHQGHECEEFFYPVRCATKTKTN